MQPELSQLEILSLSLSVTFGLAAVLGLNLWIFKKFRKWAFTTLIHSIVNLNE